MRKIISRYERERKEKKMRLFLGTFLILVMMSSVLGFAFFGGGLHGGGGGVPTNNGDNGQPNNNLNYNGFEFTNQNGLWVLNFQGDNFVFRFNPHQVNDIPGFVNPFSSYHNKPAYVYSENPEAEILVNINNLALRIQNACLEGEECANKNLPVKTCGDNFIIIKESNFTEISQQGNCVYIQGPSNSLVQIADEFLFKILGVK